MNNRKEPWEAYPDVWPTKASFFSWLQHNIHKEVFSGIEKEDIPLTDITCWEDITSFISKAMYVKPSYTFCNDSSVPAVVYWLHTTDHFSPDTDGYVGITTNIEYRLKQHEASCLGVDNYHVKHKDMIIAFKSGSIISDILYRGTYTQCLEVENNLRKSANVGWNFAVGGNGGFPKHGLTGTKIAKCFYNLRTKAIKDDIKFSWEGDIERFSDFYTSTKPPDLKGACLIREDLDKGYSPDNMIWVTREEMICRLTKYGKTEVLGRTGTISGMAREQGLKPNTVFCRLRDGWSLEEALGFVEKVKHG